MRLTWVILSVVLALAFIGTSAVAAEMYDGPDIIEGDVTWKDRSFVLQTPVMINDTATLRLMNTTLRPAVNFTGPALLVGYGPVTFTDSWLEGGRWWSVITSSKAVVVQNSTFTNASYGILTSGDLHINDSTFMDLEYGFRSGGDNLDVETTVFESCDYAFLSYSWDTWMMDVSFLNTTFIVGNIFSTSANLSGIHIDGAGEGISTSGTNLTIELTATNVKEENCEAGCGGPPVTGSVLVAGGGFVNIVDSQFSDSDGGMIGYNTDLNIENTLFQDMKGGIYGYMLEGNVTDSEFTNCSIGLEASRSEVQFIDCYFNETEIEARQWWVIRISVTDPYDDGVPYAMVTITDSKGNETAATTHVAGFLDTGMVAYQQINGTIETYGPYQLSAAKDGFEATLTNVTLEEDSSVDIYLPYYRPDINLTEITTKGRGKVKLSAVVVNDGEHVAENVTVTFTYKAGFNVIVIDTVDIGDIAPNSTETAEVTWDARDVLDEGHSEFLITANAEALNDDPVGSTADNFASIQLDAGDIDDEDDDEEPSPALIAIIIAMLVIIVFLVLKFITRAGEAPGDDIDTPKTWKETKERSKKVKETDEPRTHRGRTPAPKGRAPGRRQPPAK